MKDARVALVLLVLREVATYSADDATFYISEGLMRQSPGVIEALLARQVAHEVLGGVRAHEVGTRGRARR